MFKIKIISVHHTSASYAKDTLEKEVTSYIENELPHQNGELVDVDIQSMTVRDMVFLMAIIKYEAHLIVGTKNEYALLLNALEQMIRKKPRYLPEIKEREGIEYSFYGELINLGYNKKPVKDTPDFKEFEFKAITSNDLRDIINEGFTQHSDRVVAIIAATEKNLKELEELKTEYKVDHSEIIQLSEGQGFTNKWLAAIFLRN